MMAPHTQDKPATCEHTLPCPRCGGSGSFPATAEFRVLPPPRNADGSWLCTFCEGTGRVGNAGCWIGAT